MKRLVTFFVFSVFVHFSSILAQSVALNDDASQADSSAILDVKSNNKGILIPRLTTQERLNIINPAAGLLVFDIETESFCYFDQAWQEIKSDVNVIFEKNGTTINSTVDNTTTNFVVGSIDLPSTGTTSDTLIFFDHSKSALRGGSVNGSQWEPSKIGSNSFGFGRGVTASGNGSIAMGDGTKATGNNAIAMGHDVEATGNQSVAFGDIVGATGNQSFAFGQESYATGALSIAMGLEAVANSNSAIALGKENMADAANSTALGSSSKAQGKESTSMGKSTIANAQQSIALGIYNDPIVPADEALGPLSPILIIGNGDGNSSRSNAVVILKNGKVGFGTNDPKEQLELNGALILGNSSNVNPEAGTVRFNGSEFEGFDGINWISLEEDNDNNVNNETITSLNVGSSILTIKEAGINHTVDLSSVGNDNLGNHIATAAINMQGKSIIDLADPISGNEAATKQYVDMHQDADADSSNEKISNLALINDSLNVMEGGINSKLDLGSLKDNLGSHIASQSLNMAIERIINVAAPVDVNDAATKRYVDLHTDGDFIVGNEFQNLNLNNGLLSITNGNAVDLSDVVIGVDSELIKDTDNDTYVTTMPNDFNLNQIQVVLDNEEAMVIRDIEDDNLGTKAAITFPNNNGNIIIGNGAVNTPFTLQNNIILGNGAGNDSRGIGSIFIGADAGQKITTATPIVCIGFEAGRDFESGSGTGGNTLIGHQAGKTTTGNENTFLGYQTGHLSTTANRNVLVGNEAAHDLTSGFANTIIGESASDQITEGGFNTAVGNIAAPTLTEGNNNTFIGYQAGRDLTTGSSSVFCGSSTEVASGSSGGLVNANAFGYETVVTASNQVRIGSTFINSIGGYDGWSNVSDGRFKKNIVNEVPGLAFINLLKPVTYNLKAEALDRKLRGERDLEDVHAIRALKEKEARVYSGFIAQEVEQMAESLGYDFSGVDRPQNDNDLYGLRYATFVVPLVKAVQELSQENAQLKQGLHIQKENYNKLAAEVAELKALMLNNEISKPQVGTKEMK